MIMREMGRIYAPEYDSEYDKAQEWIHERAEQLHQSGESMSRSLMMARNEYFAKPDYEGDKYGR